MKQQSFSYLKRGLFAAVLSITVSTALQAQDNDISTLINANCNVQVKVTNDTDNPWIISDGYLKCENANSTLTLTYTSAKEQYLDVNFLIRSHKLTLLVDDKELYSFSGWHSNWIHGHYYLAVGSHTIQFIGTSISGGSDCYSLLSNLSIREFDWVDITLSMAGTLGTEVLHKVDVLDDVVQFKVHGPLNNTDWEKIHLMKNLRDIDLTDATITAIPDNEFYGCPYLQTALLPEGLTSIGNNAFRETSLAKISIPASVTSIGDGSFYADNVLTTVEIPSQSSLTTIGGSAFYNCSSLKSIQLPNGITQLNSSTFRQCQSLSSVILPNALKSIGSYCFYQTAALKNISFPSTLTSIDSYAFNESGLEKVILPQNLAILGQCAFNNCKSITYVEFPVTPNPSYFSNNNSTGYYSPFSYCTALEKVLCPSATPPLIYNNNKPFYGVDLSKVTLVVPTFAVVDYKLDTHWHEFGNIIGGAEPTQIKLASTLSLTNDRRPAKKTDIYMTVPGRLLVSGNAPLEIGMLSFNTNYNHEAISAQLLSQTKSISVDQMQTRFYATANRWYFITPMHDVNVNDITHGEADAAFVFRYYNSQNRATNGPTGSWQNLLDNTLKAGQGYILLTNKAGWITMPATTNSKAAALVIDDVTTALKSYNAASSADASWNFVGNPYPCFYDTYYMDLSAPITVRDYNNNTYRAYSPMDDNYVLRPMEAFFVQKPANQNQILFQQEGRQLTTEVLRPATARRAANGCRQLMDLTITDGIHSDHARLVLNPKASLAYETAVDATKFFSSEALVPQLYTIDDEGNQLAINERPTADGAIRLGLLVSQPGTFTISLNEGVTSLLLTDNENGQTTDLSKDSYTFTIDETGTYDSRFVLGIPDATAIESAQTASQQTEQPEQLYDLQGRRLNSSMSNSQSSILKKGIYVKNGKKQVVK